MGIEAIEAEIAEIYASGSPTSGAEGMAMMHDVRNAEVRLVHALVDEGHLVRAHDTLLGVLASAQGPEHEGALPLFDDLRARLGRTDDAPFRQIATAWLDVADHDVKCGSAREGRALARSVVRFVEERCPDAAAVAARARSL